MINGVAKIQNGAFEDSAQLTEIWLTTDEKTVKVRLGLSEDVFLSIHGHILCLQYTDINEVEHNVELYDYEGTH